MLTSPVDERLKELIVGTAEQHGGTVHSAEVMPDHVHLFAETGPTLSVGEIVNRIKRRFSRVLRQEFTWLRRGLPTLWSRSYRGRLGHDTTRPRITRRAVVAR